MSTTTPDIVSQSMEDFVSHIQSDGFLFIKYNNFMCNAYSSITGFDFNLACVCTYRNQPPDSAQTNVYGYCKPSIREPHTLEDVSIAMSYTSIESVLQDPLCTSYMYKPCRSYSEDTHTAFRRKLYDCAQLKCNNIYVNNRHYIRSMYAYDDKYSKFISDMFNSIYDGGYTRKSSTASDRVHSDTSFIHNRWAECTMPYFRHIRPGKGHNHHDYKLYSTILSDTTVLQDTRILYNKSSIYSDDYDRRDVQDYYDTLIDLGYTDKIFRESSINRHNDNVLHESEFYGLY